MNYWYISPRVASVVAAGIVLVGVLHVVRHRRRRRPVSSYLRRAAKDSSLIADRKVMIEAFIHDVSQGLPPPPPPPLRSGALRFCSWNLNVLCGPDWNTHVAAADVAAIIDELDADVLVLQETPNGTLDVLWDGCLREPIARVRELDVLLRGMGYTTQLRSCAENATLCATRCDVAATAAFTLDEDGPTASINGKEVWTESRGARYVSLIPPAGRGGAPAQVACYATHLSHKDATLVKGSPRATSKRDHSPPTATSGEPADGAVLPPMRTPADEWVGAREQSGVRSSHGLKPRSFNLRVSKDQRSSLS